MHGHQPGVRSQLRRHHGTSGSHWLTMATSRDPRDSGASISRANKKISSRMSKRARAHHSWKEKHLKKKKNNHHQDNNTALTLKQTEAVFFLQNVRCRALLWDALIAAEYVKHLKVNSSCLTARNFQIPIKSAAAGHPVLRITTTTQCFTP